MIRKHLVAGLALGTLALVATGCAENLSSPSAAEQGPRFLRWATPTQFEFQGMTAVRSPLAASISQLPAAVDQSTSATANATKLSWSHTVGTGANRLLVVGVSIRNANNHVTGVTYGGRALTFLQAQNNSDGAVRIEQWYLVAPASGTGSVTVSLSAGAKLVGGAVSFTGTDQVAPFDRLTVAGSTGTGTNNPVVADSSDISELVVSAVATEGTAGTTLTPVAGQGQAWERYYGTAGGDVAGGGSTATGAAGLSMGWTKSATAKWAIAAAAIKPAIGVSLTQYQASFWAKRGESRSIQINYSAGGGTSPFLRLTVSDPTYVPGIGNLAVGDSVLMTATVDPTAMAVSFAPSGTQFGTPSQLQVWYGGAGGDLNGDGVVDSSDAYIESHLLGMWYQADSTTAWTSITATQSLTDKSFTAPLAHFSGYAVAW